MTNAIYTAILYLINKQTKHTLVAEDDDPEGGLVFPVLRGSFLGVGSLSLSEDTVSTDDWLEVQDEALLSSTAFFGGGPEERLPLLLFTLVSLEFESSFSVGVIVDGEVSLSSLDFLDPLLGLGDVFGLFLDDLLSVSDSELLSGENILFFFNKLSDLIAGLDKVLGIGLGVLAPDIVRCMDLPLASTLAAFLGLAEHLLLGGKDIGLCSLGMSSSLDEDGLGLVDGLRGFGSSFFLGSSKGLAGLGDFGMGMSAKAGGSEADESESELLELDPELVEELPLLLVSDDDPELLSVLVFITYNKQ